MAYVDDPNKKQNQNTMGVLQPSADGTQAPQGSQQPPSTPVSGGQAGSIQTAPSPRQQQKPASSGTFTNLQQYKQANTGAGSRVAGAVQSNIQNIGKQGQAKLGNVESEFTNKMNEASRFAATEEERKAAIENVRAYTQRESGIQEPQTLPQDFDEQRFSDITNKEYTGIERADQTKSYTQATDIYRNLQNKLAQTKDPNQSTALLKDVFKNQTDQYGTGKQKLDALFFDTSREALNTRMSDEFSKLYQQPQQMSDLRTRLSSAAQARREAIDEMRQKAQEAFRDVAKTRTGQVEDRLTGVETNWENLANYFRDALRDKQGNVALSDLEAKTLGLQAGDQLFNLTKADNISDFIKSAQFERDRNISKQEQQNLARLEALSNLAKQDYTNKYYNAELAGTQSALDALDIQNVRNKLNEAMKGFENVSGEQTIGQGTGSSAYDKFNWDPKNMGWYSQGVGASATQAGRLQDVLKQSGYSFEQSGGQNVGTTDYLKKLAMLDQDTVKGDLRDYFMNSDYLNQNLIGAATMADPQATLDTARNLISDIGSSAENISSSMTDAAKDAVDIFSNTNPVVGGTIAGIDKLTGIDLNKLTKNALEDVDYLYNPLAAIGGLNKMLTGSKADERRAQAEAQLRAYEAANVDLKKRMQNTLNTQGFYNVANIANKEDAAVAARASALQDLIKKLDKTNV
jgi:hypothetical protein